MNKLNVSEGIGDIDQSNILFSKYCARKHQLNKASAEILADKQIFLENKSKNLTSDLGFVQYREELKLAAEISDLRAYFAIMAKYHNVNAEIMAKYYAYAFYIAEHYGSEEIKQNIYIFISNLISKNLANDLRMLVSLLQYKKEFHSIYPQMMALLQVYINQSVQSLSYNKLKKIYCDDIPEQFLCKNFTYLVEIPTRYAKQISKAFPHDGNAQKIFTLLTNLKVNLLG